MVVRTPDELIAALPHLLGFKPDESIVFVPMRSDIPVARVDLPTTPIDRELVWRYLRDAFSRYGGTRASVGIVCVTDDRTYADVVGREFADRLDSIGIGTQMRLWANDSHWSDLDSGESGLQTESARERIAAMTVLAGQAQPAASRGSLATSLVGDREPVAKLLPQAREAARLSTPRAESRWALGRLNQFHANGHLLSDGDAARLLVAIVSIPIRDRLLDDMNRSATGSHVALWTDMTKRAPDEVRAAPASMLAFASWQNGNGAMAWCALDQVPQDKPYSLAGVVATAVQTGMHPREWEAIRSQHPDRGPDLGSDFPTQQGRAQPSPDRPEHGM
ncbi:hypothetical protein C1I92_26470 [Jiangella anatolica]|uniref:DUF4192 domain-containing protein n=2 Tax=Jiangella anatolica TaxID=2670374 RepID=A0A2W2B5R5_9ACTN|nr:hypothetical protein C1I92_26470 [Jiangella anatolica]